MIQYQPSAGGSRLASKIVVTPNTKMLRRATSRIQDHQFTAQPCFRSVEFAISASLRVKTETTASVATTIEKTGTCSGIAAVRTRPRGSLPTWECTNKLGRVSW